MTRIGVWALLLGYAVQCVAAGIEEFKFHKDIDRGGAGGEGIVAVALDADVYAATRDGLPDLRIFDSQGRETPFLVENVVEPRMHVVRTACQGRVLSLSEKRDGLEVIVRLKDDEPAAAGLTIFTPLQNYERRVSVLGSDDGTDWTPLVEAGLVFDYSRYMDISSNEVRLPKNDFRQFKILIAGVSDTKESPFLELTRKQRGGADAERVERTMLERRPFRMDRIDLWGEKSEKLSECEKMVDYPPVDFRVEENGEEKTTRVYIHARREPLTELTPETSSRNFSRAAEVQSPVKHGVHTEWTDIGQGSVSLVDFGGYHKQSLSISFPEHRASEYCLVIHNQDSPPLTITGIKARGNVERAIFLAADGETYRLAYGADDTQPPSYDAAAVLGTLQSRGNQPVECRLGKQVAAGVAPSPAFTIGRILNNSVLLGVVIVVLVAALGWALFRASSRISDISEDR